MLSLGIAVGLLAGVLPNVADLPAVWRVVRGLEIGQIAALVLLAGWNIATYQFVMMSALPGLPWRQAFMVGQISTAVANTIPAGGAIGVGVTYAMFSSYGFSATEIGLAAALTGLWNTFVKLGLPIVAMGIVAVTGDPHPALLSTALIGVAILVAAVTLLAVVAASDRFAVGIGERLGAVTSRLARPLRRGPFVDWGLRFRDFRVRASGLLARRWASLTLTTVLSHGSLFVLLLVSLRMLGVPGTAVTWPEALAAFALVRLVTALPITPGGLGVVELGMTAALVLAGGTQTAVVAAVLVFRVLSYLAQVPIGLVCWIIWRAAPPPHIGSTPSMAP